MAVLSISRDWGVTPSIVRMETNDAFPAFQNPDSNYLVAHQDEIESLNHGPFTWLDTDMIVISTQLTSFVASVEVDDNGVPSIGRSMNYQIVTYHKKTADSAAADTIDESPLVVAPDTIIALSARIAPSSALTADDTNYATFNFYSRDENGASQTLLRTFTTETSGSGGSGDWTAFNVIGVGGLGGSSIPKFGTITFEMTKAGTGVVVPALMLQTEIAYV